MRKKTVVTICSIYLFAAVFAACASKPSSEKGDGAPASRSSGSVPTTSEIREKYSVNQLDAAANLLKVISDTAGDPKKDGGTEIVGCAITGGKALSMTMPVKSLIDSRLTAEREAYTQGPLAYGDSNSFETCAVSCSCGVMSDVVRGASQRGMKKNDLKYHERWAQRLKLKAAALSERETKACAVKQTWFCGSDLQRYLEAQTGGMP